MGREAKAVWKICRQTALGERGSAGAQWRACKFMTERGAHRSIRPPSKPKIHQEPNHLPRTLSSLLFDEGFRTKNQYGNLCLRLGEQGSQQLACVYLISPSKDANLGSKVGFFFHTDERNYLQTPGHYFYYNTINIFSNTTAQLATFEKCFLAPINEIH